jgi:glycosyltransferase involved in cell wall biosynthesis
MTRRMRIAHISGCLDMGGQEKLLVEFAKHADRDRFDLRFVSLGTRGILADELESAGWPVTALDVAPGLHLRLPWRLAKRLRAWETDVVHTHNDRPLVYGAPAARLARVGGVIHTKHGRGTYNSRRQTLLGAWTARLTDQFVCVSDECARLARAQGVPASRICTLHNGIDTRRFTMSGPDLAGPAVVVARLCADKDLATLLHATAHVIAASPRFRLWIAGDGPEGPALRELANRLGLADAVRFLGQVRDVPALLGQARMFVLSSVSEGVPLTLLEAMASGLPCVATRVGGIPEVLHDGADGLMIEPREPAALASALLRLHADDELANRLGQAGRRRVVEQFDVRRMVERYEQIYVSFENCPGKRDSSAMPPATREEVHGCASHT